MRSSTCTLRRAIVSCGLALLTSGLASRAQTPATSPCPHDLRELERNLSPSANDSLAALICRECEAALPGSCEYARLARLPLRLLNSGDLRGADSVVGLVLANRYVRTDAGRTARGAVLGVRAGRQRLEQKVDSALATFRLVARLYGEAGDTSGQVRTLMNFGTTFQSMGAPDSAAHYLVEAQRLAEAVGDAYLIAAGRALLCTALANFNSADALPTCRSALAPARAENIPNLPTLLSTLGGQLREVGDLDSAAYYFRESNCLTQSPYTRFNNFFNLADLRIESGDRNGARVYADSALTIARLLGTPEEMASAEVQIGRIAIDRRDFREADDHLTRAVEIFDEIDYDPTIELGAYFALATARAGAGRPLELARVLQTQAHHDSLVAVARREAVATLARQFDDEKRLAEIERLETVRVAQAATVQARGRALVITLVFIVVLVGLLVYLARLRGRADATARSLATLNGELRDRNARIERLHSELNHRTASHIGLAYRLIRHRQQKVSDPALRAALAESETQLLTLSTINRYLVERDGETARLDQLIARITADMQAVSPVAFDVDLEAEPIEVSARDATNNALVLHELLSNSIKYAFADETAVAEPRVRIEVSRPAPDAVAVEYRDNGPGKDGRIRGTGQGATLVSDFLTDLDAEMTEGGAPGFRLRYTWAA